MQLNGFQKYTKGILPGNTSGADFVNIEFKNCIPINSVPTTPVKVEKRATQQNFEMKTEKETNASNFPKIKI